MLLGSSRSAVIVTTAGPAGKVKEYTLGPISALVAAPPSPVFPDEPFPAIVEITPADVTSRTRKLDRASQMYRLPDASNLEKVAEEILALVAAPLSPEKPLVPVPTTV